MSYPFTLFQRPDGRQSEHEMTKIRPEEEAALREMNVKLSLEEISTGQMVIYADDDYVMKDDPSTPDEIVYIVKSEQTCEDAMAEIVALLRARREECVRTVPEAIQENRESLFEQMADKTKGPDAFGYRPFDPKIVGRLLEERYPMGYRSEDEES